MSTRWATAGKIALILLGLLMLAAIATIVAFACAYALPYIWAFFFADPGTPR